MTNRQAPITNFSPLELRDTKSRSETRSAANSKLSHGAGSSYSRGPESVASAQQSVRSSQIPPHLNSAMSRAKIDDGLGRLGSSGPHEYEENPGGSLHGHLPRHLRAKTASIGPHAMASQKGADTSSSQASGVRSISTATTMRNEQQSNSKIPFNAWDITGKHHDAIKSPTDSEPGTMSTASESASEDPDEAAGWTKITAKKQNSPGSRGKWHTAPRVSVGRRLTIKVNH